MRGVRHLLALGTAAVCGVLLYCLRLRFPNPLTEALGPANASPWETGKLVFWAMLPAAAVLRRQGIRPVCIFTGSDQELDSARRIYGAAVERIPTAGWLADAVSRLLCAQLTRT